MLLFWRKKDYGVQTFLLKLLNSQRVDQESFSDGPRLEGRANLALVVLLVPLAKGKPQLEQTFTAVTKEFATAGLSLVLAEPQAVDQVLVGFRTEGGLKFFGQAKHLNPMGGGFYQLGLKLIEVVHVSDYPGLERLTF